LIKRTRNARLVPRNRYVPYLLGRVSKGAASAASVLYREWLGVGINNARVVNALVRRPGCTAVDLSAETGLDKAVISRSLNALRAKNLIRFDDAARRRRKVDLTASGLTLSRRIMRMMLDRERMLLRGFSTAEKSRLVDYLQRMLVNVPYANAYRPPASIRRARKPGR
jgi:DNA-binding MarR family transcriptional regulator